MKHEWRLFLVALQFLTRVPVPAWVDYRPAWLDASARHFSLVGAAVGAFGALVLWFASAWWPAPVAVGLSMASTLLLTGAFHEDGFADVCDGLGGSVSRERALEIMKDSRLGSYGVIGIAVLLGLKAAALSQLPLLSACAALVLAHSVSRAVAVSLTRWLPYAGDAEDSKAKPLARQVSGAGWVVALAWPLLVLTVGLCAASPWHALDTPGFAAPIDWSLAFVAAAAAGYGCARWFRRRLGGFTGDCLGAAQQLSELAFYLALLATLRVV